MSRSRERGLTLAEVVIFIVVVGIAIVGVVVLFNQLTKQSADPGVRKQALAIAQSLMEEIQLQPFTFCDPDDSAVYTAQPATYNTDCATVEGIGHEGEGRYPSAANRFDNVSDYDGFSMSGATIKDITETAIPGMTGYSVIVQVSATNADFPNGGGGATPIDAGDALLIAVTVTGPIGVTVTLHGYRLRYAPNSP